ncbi:MAG: hypothetical protein PUB97_10895 [Ruminococcus sp.]|nr:hypothetical protein [Ruminococcus sp.]
MSAKIADVMQDLKNYARTEEQTRITADKLYELADYALRVSVDEALRNQEQGRKKKSNPNRILNCNWNSGCVIAQYLEGLT